MRNPVSYTLPKDFTAKDVDRIFDSMRRRARAAFAHQWSNISHVFVEDGVIGRKLKTNAAAVEKTLADSWGYCKTVMASDVGSYARHELVQHGGINAANKLLKNYEAECFQRVRGARAVKKYADRPRTQEGTWLSQVKVFMTRLSMAYPYVSKKNRHRLATALRKLILIHPDWNMRHRAIAPKQLLEFGIPAAEIAGPWWVRTQTTKRPMDWVERGVMSDKEMARAYSSLRSTDWIEGIGLDGGDRDLVQAVNQYYEREGQAPSVEWARRRSNELDEERTQKDMEEQIPKVEEWLEASSYWRRSADYADITIPELPDPTFRVLKPGDGDLLCRAAKRDGLCVVDSITNLVDEAESRLRGMHEDEEEAFTEKLYKLSEKENFVTLIISTDPKRRTVVGLNSAGVCTSEHHCTGIQNKVDKVAYEYFRKSSR